MPFDPNNNKKNSVRAVVLMGVFWRILIIEGILLVGTLIYAALTEDKGSVELFWYAVRIISLVAIIVLFMMVTLKSFLGKRIISPLETIAAANQRFQDDNASAIGVDLPANTPREIRGIVSSRTEMLNTILDVSEERLRLVKFIRNTFGRYLSKRVVDEILESPNGQEIGGRRKTVTVLMSDLRGFTSLSETRDPEDMVRLLNRYLARMSEVIIEYDGTIDEFIGDAILTIFGVPEEHDDDPLRAVACAIAMQQAMAQVNAENRDKGLPELEMGIGLNEAEVIVGNIGSAKRSKYAVVGSGVNMASRIESYTVGGQILISESVRKEAGDILRIDSQREVFPKGAETPLKIYEVGGIAGCFNLSLEEDKSVPVTLSHKIPMQYKVLRGKDAGKKVTEGSIVSLSRKCAEIELDEALASLTNLKMNLAEVEDALMKKDFYGKVLVHTDERNQIHKIRFTAVPPEVRAYFQAIRRYAVSPSPD